MNQQHYGQPKAFSAFSCAGMPQTMPHLSFRGLSFNSFTDHCFITFVQEQWGFVFEISANSTSLLFVSASVYSGAKFSLSKMKKNQDRHLLVTPLNILCIHKKCSELFYDQLVRIHTKGYMQKANRLLRNDSLPHTVSLLCIPTADSRKISVAVLWHYYKHLAWPRFQPSHS